MDRFQYCLFGKCANCVRNKDNCTADQWYDFIKETCRQNCPADQRLDWSNNKCVYKNSCPSDKIWNSTAQACSKDFLKLILTDTSTATALTYRIAWKNSNMVYFLPPLTETNFGDYVKASIVGYTYLEDFDYQFKY